MTRRHLSLPHRFVCLTDDPHALDDGIHVISIPETPLEFCWTKLLMFSPQTPEIGSTILYLDLDVVVTRRIDELLTFRPEADFLSVPDWNRWWMPQFNSSVMRFTAGKHDALFNDFMAATVSGVLTKRREWDACLGSRDKVVYRSGWARYGSDQEWISHYFRKRGGIRDRAFPPGWIVSYKTHCRAGLPPEARVVVFHGRPKPHEIPDGPVREQWG